MPPQVREVDLAAQRERVAELDRRLGGLVGPAAADLRSVADHLLRRSVWIVGGDGWAYDIGSGGLDHVLASGRDVNVLVLDTEVYSNTGGQSSKATPLGAVAKFAAAGKAIAKKDLALQAIAYGSVYVARVAMGADPQQTLTAFREAEAYDGPSLDHRLQPLHRPRHRDANGLDQQYRAVGVRALAARCATTRRCAGAGENPFMLDSPRPRIPLEDYVYRELRYRMLRNADPAEAERLLALAQEAVDQRWATYEEMATRGAARFLTDATEGALMNLGTHYLGLALRNPLVASASPLSEGVDRVRALVDAGVGAVVLYSLFEEEVTREQLREVQLTERTRTPSARPCPTAGAVRVGTPDGVGADSAAPGRCDATSTSSSGRPLRSTYRSSRASTARREAGGHGSPGRWRTPGPRPSSSTSTSSPATRTRAVARSRTGTSRSSTPSRRRCPIPVAVKLSPHFSSPGEMALRLDDAGADGLVLFNRFLQPDVDTESLQVNPGVTLSVPSEARLPRTWIAILRGHVTGSLAATTGVDRAEDVVAYLLAGADVVMTASALLRHGVGHAQVLLDGLESWAERKGFSTLDDVRGRLAVPRDVDLTAHQRAGYVAALGHARRTYGALSSPTAPEVL